MVNIGANENAMAQYMVSAYKEGYCVIWDMWGTLSYPLQQLKRRAINQGKLCCHKCNRRQTSTAIDRQHGFWNTTEATKQFYQTQQQQTIRLHHRLIHHGNNLEGATANQVSSAINNEREFGYYIWILCLAYLFKINLRYSLDVQART